MLRALSQPARGRKGMVFLGISIILIGCDAGRIYDARTVSGDELLNIIPDGAFTTPISLSGARADPGTVRLSGALHLPSELDCSNSNDEIGCGRKPGDQIDLESFEAELQFVSDEVREALTSPDIRELELNSVGGNMLVGLAIAEIVSEVELDTVVRGGDVCMSACVAILMAGRQRIAHGAVGLHYAEVLFSGPLSDGDIRGIQDILGLALHAKIRDNVPVELSQIEYETPPEKMAILTREQKVRFGLLSPTVLDRWILRAPPRARSHLPVGAPVDAPVE